jgi:hypothetical protein
MRLVAPLVIVDYFVFAARPGASARRAARHAARRAARRRLLRLAQAHRQLLRPRCTSECLGTSCGSSCASRRLVFDYSVRRDFVLRPRWLYFIDAVRRDYLSRGNTGSTSSMPHAAMTSSSSRIALTIHLD